MLQIILAATDVGIAVCLSFLSDFLSRSFLHIVTIPTSDFFSFLASDQSYFLAFLASDHCCAIPTLQYFLLKSFCLIVHAFLPIYSIGTVEFP